MKVPLSDIYLDDGAIQVVSRVLSSKRYILGEETSSFEREFAQKLGAHHAIAVSSGTSALHLAFIASDLGEGDEVIVPSFSFVATASPLVHLGVRPVFCDVDPDTLTLDPNDLRRKITNRTKAVVPVHLFGHPAAMDEITEIADQKSLKIIEDSAQAHGSMLGGKFVGSFGIASCYSFYPSKNMTVYGDGGMVTTNDSAFADEVRMLRNHGRSEKYVHQSFGYNFRMSEIAAALGRYQLSKLDSFNKARREAARFYDDELRSYLETPTETRNARHVYHMYVVRTQRRDQLKAFLAQKGVETGIHYPIPIHLQPAFTSLARSDKLPVTEESCETVLSLPIYPTISRDQLNYISHQTKTFLQSNS